MEYEFNDSDRAVAAHLFDKIRALSANGPYHPGVTRPSYSAVETAAIREIEACAYAYGCTVYYDSAANLWIDLPEMTPGPAIWIGSHIDSVPQGGNFDGLAGIVAGLLCLRKIKQHGSRRQVRVIALRGEESAWFGIPYIGAKALLGKLTQEDLARTFQRSGEPLREHMKNCGASIDRVSRGVQLVEPRNVTEYWELHIEQGPVLVEKKLPVGIVTGIRGNVRHSNVRITGREGHSGTVPRELRSDAVFAFAEFIRALDTGWADIASRGRSHDLVVTCGIVETDSTVHGITRIPGSVRFCLEWRSLFDDVLDGFAAHVDNVRRVIEAERGVTFTFDAATRTAPAACTQALAERAALACTHLDLPQMMLPSGAGHDAAIFAGEGIPTGMIFVRNENGSHNPDEAMDLDDFMRGVEVLYKVVTARVP